MLALRSIAAPAQRQAFRAAPRAVSVSFQNRFYSSRVAQFTGQKDASGKYTVSLIEGDGIGPEIAVAVKDIFAAAQTPINWEPINVDPILKDGKTAIPDAAIESIRRNKIALKGPLAVCCPLGLNSQRWQPY